MKKNMLWKDFFVEISRSFNRFISIFAIVALGVAFFSGIRATEPDLRYSADTYFDRNQLMDIRVMSTLGLTDDDVEALRGIEGVSDVVPGYSVDALCNVGEIQQVFKIISDLGSMNQITVSEGRMPEKAGECLLDAGSLSDSGYQIGDKIVFHLDDDQELSDMLSCDTFEIVGIGSSPEYITFSRGSTTIGDGEISAFAIVTADSFCSEVYTQINMTVEGAADQVAYTTAYENLIEAVKDRISDNFADVRCEARYQEVVSEANEKIIDARQELSDAKADAEQELDDAFTELTDGETALKEGEEALEEKRQELSDAKSQIAASEKQLASARAILNSGRVTLDQGWNDYNTGLAQYNEGLATLDQKKAEAESQFAEARTNLDQGWAEYNATLAQRDTAAAQLSEIQAQIDALNNAGQPVPQQLSDGKIQLRAAIVMFDAALPGALQQLEDGEAELAAQRQAYENNPELIAARQELDAAKVTLDAAYEKLAAGEAEAKAGQEQIASGEAQLKTVRSQLSDGEKQLSEADEEIAKKKQELADGWQKYYDGKAEAEKKIADAEAELSDAEVKVADIDYPEWYIFDRSTLPGYDECGENANRIKAIGQVFPVLFFLVAALISLTTMTRMVEEQRTQIGTLKALGYGKGAIAKKYIYYAMLATISGSLVGVLIGEKVIPYIIVNAYKIMYAHMPDIVIPYEYKYSLLATLAAVVCILAATLFSCYRELSDAPANLMRPVPPKQGKRILLERVTVLWKRLSFTQKSTLRNLFRYKKRFLMTIFGIGGCTALMLVGFGIKDSITDIGNLQYDKLQPYSGMAMMDDAADTFDWDQLYQVMDQDERILGHKTAYMQNTDISSAKKSLEAYVVVPEDLENIGDYYLFNNRVTGETYTLTDDGIILTEKTARMLSVGVGEQIQIKINELETREVTISHIVENYVMHYVYMTPSLYEEIYEKNVEYNIVLFKIDGEGEAIETVVGQDLLKQEGVINVSYMKNMKERLEDILGALDIIIVVLIISAGMLAFVVLYNLNNININERKRELASIKVLGFYDLEVAAYVYRENIYLTIIGIGAGLVLGKILHNFVIQTVEIDNCMFGRSINFPSYIYALLFTLGFSVIVNAAMYFKLKKIDMVESLKSVE